MLIDTGFHTLPIVIEPGRSPGKGKETRATRVAAFVRDAIIGGLLAPGQRINLNALKEAQGVSLSPLREAVARLAQERLVIVEDQRGFRTAPVSRPDLCEIVEMRIDLSALAVGIAIERADIDWEGRVLSAAHRLRKEPGAGNGQHDFLRTMVSGCERQMLVDFCAMLDNLNLRYLHLLGRSKSGPDAEVAPLADAAVARKKDLAIALLRQWMERVGAETVQQWDAAASTAGRGR